MPCPRGGTSLLQRIVAASFPASDLFFSPRLLYSSSYAPGAFLLLSKRRPMQLTGCPTWLYATSTYHLYPQSLSIFYQCHLYGPFLWAISMGHLYGPSVCGISLRGELPETLCAIGDAVGFYACGGCAVSACKARPRTLLPIALAPCAQGRGLYPLFCKA